MHDLDEAAADFRARRGRPMRVATKYHALARRFFAEKGVADYRLVDSQGATEAAPRNGAAELIVDITTSGETLRANHLRVLADGLILRSEAVLALSRRAPWPWRVREALEAMGGRLGFDAAALGL
jgi:ATP phosphoribosyltransferase